MGSGIRFAVLALLSLGPAAAAPAWAASGVVPDDFATIQGALDQAGPGDTIQVKERGQPYAEKVRFRRSGDAVRGFLSLEAYPGHRPVLDGTGVTGSDLVLLDGLSYVRVSGLVLRNNLGVNDGSGVRVLGSGSRIEILGNEIHDVRGSDAMGITVYGTDPLVSISDLVIDGNFIHDCEPALSEALTLNGNVERFVVSNNVVRDVNNIGIDLIGGETSICPDPSKVARDGVVRGNRVERARSDNGGGWGAGIYVDGGRDIVLENNVVTECDLGLEVGAENAGTDATGITVRNNLIFGNDKAGLVFGGYDASVGRVRNCRFLHNTVVGNDRLGTGLGELWIQFADANQVRGNLFVAGPSQVLHYSEGGNAGNDLDWNLWYAPGGTGAGEFTWRGVSYAGFDAWRLASGQDASGLSGDPLLSDPASGDLHLRAGSPAIDRGDPAYAPDPTEVDLDDLARVVGGRVDAGADEYVPACIASGLPPLNDLRVVRVGPGALFSWTPDPSVPFAHVNAVDGKASLLGAGPHRPPLPGAAAAGACDATAPASSCLDPDAVSEAVSPLYYRVLGACGDGGALEGPAD